MLKIDFFWDNDKSINDIRTLDAAPPYVKQSEMIQNIRQGYTSQQQANNLFEMNKIETINLKFSELIC